MEWLNVFGLIFVTLIMIPNVFFAIKNKQGFENSFKSKPLEIPENIGRAGCFAFMIINIPGTWLGWWSDEAFAVYLIINAALTLTYCIIWIACFKRNSMFRAVALSVIPSLIFLFSGFMSRSLLLVISAVIFAPIHILISYKNAVADKTSR